MEKRVRMLGMVILIITLLFFIASIIVHEYKKSDCQKVKGVVVDRSVGGFFPKIVRVAFIAEDGKEYVVRLKYLPFQSSFINTVNVWYKKDNPQKAYANMNYRVLFYTSLIGLSAVIMLISPAKFKMFPD